MPDDTPNRPTKKAEQKRGYQEGARQIELLRARWPKAFPEKSHEVRPLTNEAQRAMSEAFGWTPAYARAVLTVWKLRPAYCQAVLWYPKRINLDGSVSDEEVEDNARAAAKARLEHNAAQRVKRAKRDKLRAAAREERARLQAPEPTPAPVIADAEAELEAEPIAPPELPKPRKLLVAGSAAMQAALQRRLASGAVTTDVLKTVEAPSASRKREQRAR